MQDAWKQLNKNRLAENDESDAQRKNSEEADMVIDMTAEHRYEVTVQQRCDGCLRSQAETGLNQHSDGSDCRGAQGYSSRTDPETRKRKKFGAGARQTAREEWQRVVLEHTGSPSRNQRQAE